MTDMEPVGNGTVSSGRGKGRQRLKGEMVWGEPGSRQAVGAGEAWKVSTQDGAPVCYCYAVPLPLYPGKPNKAIGAKAKLFSRTQVGEPAWLQRK